MKTYQAIIQLIKANRTLNKHVAKETINELAVKITNDNFGLAVDELRPRFTTLIQYQPTDLPVNFVTTDVKPIGVEESGQFGEQKQISLSKSEGMENFNPSFPLDKVDIYDVNNYQKEPSSKPRRPRDFRNILEP